MEWKRAWDHGVDQRIPILLLNGTADTTTPMHMSRGPADIIPGAELVEFDGVTHMGLTLLKKDGHRAFGRYVNFIKNLIGREKGMD